MSLLTAHLSRLKRLAAADGALVSAMVLSALFVFLQDDMPLAWTASALMGGAAFQIGSGRRLSRRRFVTLSAFLTAGVLYGILLLTHSAALAAAAESFLILWILGNGLLWCTFREDFLPMALRRASQFFIALSWAAAVGLSVFAAAWIVTHIIDFPAPWPARLRQLAPASAVLAFLSAALSGEDAPFRPGRFFRRLFGTVLPLLTAAAGLLGAVYFLQVLFGFRPDPDLSSLYYPYLLLFFAAFLAGRLAPVPARLGRLTGILFIILPLLAAAILLRRLIAFPGNPAPFYGLAVNALFLGSVITVLWKKPSWKLAVWAFAAGFILFCPLLGWHDYHRFVTYSGEKPHLTAHYSLHDILLEKREKNGIESFYDRFQAASDMKDYVYFTSGGKEMDFPLHRFRHIHLHSRLTSASPKTFGAVTLSFEEDGKILTVQSERGNISFPLYDKARKEMGADADPLRLEGEGWLIIVEEYSFHTASEGSQADMTATILTE